MCGKKSPLSFATTLETRHNKDARNHNIKNNVLIVNTLECLINVPVRVFISRKMPPYTGPIWYYTFIFFLNKKKVIKKFAHVYYTVPRQFLRKATNSPNLVVNKSWYLYNVSLGRLLEGDPLECCLLIQAAGTGSNCSSSHFAYNLWDWPWPYTLIWHYTIIKFVRFATIWHYTFIRHSRITITYEYPVNKV